MSKTKKIVLGYTIVMVLCGMSSLITERAREAEAVQWDQYTQAIKIQVVEEELAGRNLMEDFK